MSELLFDLAPGIRLPRLITVVIDVFPTEIEASNHGDGTGYDHKGPDTHFDGVVKPIFTMKLSVGESAFHCRRLLGIRVGHKAHQLGVHIVD